MVMYSCRMMLNICYFVCFTTLFKSAVVSSLLGARVYMRVLAVRLLPFGRCVALDSCCTAAALPKGLWERRSVGNHTRPPDSPMATSLPQVSSCCCSESEWEIHRPATHTQTCTAFSSNTHTHMHAVTHTHTNRLSEHNTVHTSFVCLSPHCHLDHASRKVDCPSSQRNSYTVFFSLWSFRMVLY